MAMRRMGRLKRRQNDSSISDNCSIDPPLLSSIPTLCFDGANLVGFSAFFDNGEKYRARYCVRRELRLVNRPILFNRLYRVNNRIYLPYRSLSAFLYPLFYLLFYRCPIHSG